MKSICSLRTSLLIPLIGILLAPSAFAVVTQKSAPVAVPADAAWDKLKLIWDKGDDADKASATPIGNAHIAAKIRGGVASETLHLNNKTFWSSWPKDENDPKRRDAMLDTRRKLAAGDYDGAEKSAKGMWGPNYTASYLPLGNLIVNFDHGSNAENYSRELDLDKALSTVRYTINNITYTRETFASYPDRVIVMRLTASRPGSLTFTTKLENPVEMGENGSVSLEDRDTLVMRGRAPSFDLKTWHPEKGMKHETRVRVLPQGGRMASGSAPGSLRIESADSVIFIIADATSYNGYNKEPGTQGVDPAPIVRADLAEISNKKYDALFATHQADYRALFRRVWVNINDDETQKNALTYQFMRYSMIAVSRNGDIPNNLLGIWSNIWKAHSGGAFFLNENVEKYYAIIETGNLPETGAPLWNWMSHVAANGTKTAQVDWGFKGWMVGHCSDVWATTPLRSSNNEWALWPSGGFWLCQNLWDHYAFSLDTEFLRNEAYPILKGAGEFALDFLVEDKDGHLVPSPTSSPENRFALEDHGTAYAVTAGSTIDIALIHELFENLIIASKTLGVDPEFRTKIEVALPRLKPLQISQRESSKGELQEWADDFSRLPGEGTNKYNPQRHASHLVAVWPLHQITKYTTPDLFEAAKLSLENRGRGGYHPDKAAMWARLQEGDKALQFIGGMGHKTAGMFPPIYSAFAEMIVQSHAGEIELLPAIPTAWKKSGQASGLRARGGYTLSIEWKDGALVRCQIDSQSGTIPVVRYQGKLLDVAKDNRINVNIL